MTARILIVDDDQAQLRLLARLISMRRRDLTVLTATHGLEAVEVLESMQVDLVLTDLQMPEMNGFEVLAWLLTHQPHVHACAMTAYPDADAVRRLTELKSIECFTKPVDISAFIARMTEALSTGARGHVHNIGLPSFLQLLGMERETCRLTIEAEGSVGHLYLRDGELIDARTGVLEGRAAAVEIIGWRAPAITISNTPYDRARVIEEPLGFLIMEAMRVEDELHETQRTAGRKDEVVAQEELPAYVRATAIVSRRDGTPDTATGDWSDFEALPRVAAQLYEPRVEEIVLTGPRFWFVAQPLDVGADWLAVVVFDASAGHLIGARAVLKRLAAEHMPQRRP